MRSRIGGVAAQSGPAALLDCRRRCRDVRASLTIGLAIDHRVEYLWSAATQPGSFQAPTVRPLRVTAVRRFIPVLLLLAMACPASEHIASPPLDVGAHGVAVMKARRARSDYLLLLETLKPLADVERPDRMLRRVRLDASQLDYVPPDGSTIADFATHPSGEVSIMLVSDAGYALERWTSDGARSGPVTVEGLAPSSWSHDAARVAPLGEDVVLALRADDNAVRAFRYAPNAGRYQKVWDTLVEPANDLLPRALISGSFDTFGQLRTPFRAYVDIGPDGAVWIGVLNDPGTDLVEVHNATFGDDLRGVSETGPSYDVLVTLLEPTGRRVFSRMVGTQWHDEIYGLRAVSDALLVVGRSETVPGDASGWDGLLARVTEAGTVSARTFDVDAGDILFDADVLDDGRTIVVGATGYTDNPSGGSISETCSLLALVVTSQAAIRVALPNLPRHNQLRTVLADEATVWVAGMSDGPGTHSGDTDRSVIRADPFVAALALP